MNGSALTKALIKTLIIGCVFAGIVSAQEIHLKTRDVPAVSSERARPRAGVDAHQLVQFDHTPSVEDLDALLAGGATVVSVVPDNAVVVSSPGTVVPTGAGIRTVIRIDPADKLSPALGTSGISEPFTVIVEFHADVTVDQQNAVAQAEGMTLARPAVLAASHAITTGALTDLQALAAHDEVAYIFPADPALLTDNTFNMCAGMITLSGPVAQYSNLIHGWTPDADGIAHLGYVFGTLTTKVTATLVESEIVRALNTWAQYTNVAFQPGTSATAPRTIAIKFASGAHGDSYPFDGPGGILAHTFYPVPVNPESIAGDMHLDADENWHSGGDVDIYTVALHEAGHAIGLGHTDNPGDIMYPYYHRGAALSANDIGAARALYGLPLSAAPTPVTTTSTTTNGTTAQAPATLRLTLDSTPASAQSSQVSISGTVSGGVGPYTVQWQSDHGYSGRATFTSSVGWTVAGISLVSGENTISVTAFDASHQTSSQTVTVTFTPAQISANTGNTSPICVAISAPAAPVVTVGASTFSIAGTASGGAGITKVTWQSSTGFSGTASGTTHWLASSIPLLVGTNTIVVRAYDSKGVSAWAAVVAIRH